MSNDASWDSSLPPRPKSLSAEVKDAYKTCVYKSHYISMRDGVRLACDVYLPKSSRLGNKFTTVFIQHRYMRGAAFRWPLSWLMNGLPIDFISHDLKASLIANGYAVVSLDIRGTGASFGQWRAPWLLEERKDSLEVLDWICLQPWSNSKVMLSGVSYEATAALFTVAGCHHAVKGAMLLYPFWDLYNDISFPGGVPQRSFIDTWSKVCLALDANSVGGLSIFLPIFFRGVQPIVEEPRSQDSKPLEAENWGVLSCIPGYRWCYSCFSSWWEGWKAYARAEKLVKEAVRGHASWDASKSARVIRYTDQEDPAIGLPTTAGSPCTLAREIAASGVPLLLVAGWLDATASPAINAFFHSAKAPGSELIIGPWGHSGIINNSMQHEHVGTPSRFQIFHHITQFLDRCDRQEPATANGPTALGDDERTPSSPVILDVAATPDQSPERRQSEPQRELREGPPGNAEHELEIRENGEVGGREGSIGAADLLAKALAPSMAPIQPLSVSACCGTGGEGMDSQTRDSEGEHTSTEPVHYYTMGYEAGWKSASRWPPAQLAAHPLELSLAGIGGVGTLAQHGPAEPLRWEHVIDSWKHPKGVSRFDAMTDLSTPIRYKNLDCCGHLLFTGAPLAHALEVTGWPEVELWVESCDQDADIFCYLESYNPHTGSVAYVTEGSFRASHHKEYSAPPNDDPRALAVLPGSPFHSHCQADRQLLQPGQLVKCRFQLLPTSLCFTPGHCVRLAISGSDSKHFQQDLPCDGSRTLWIHSGPETPSCLRLPIAESSD